MTLSDLRAAMTSQARSPPQVQWRAAALCRDAGAGFRQVEQLHRDIGSAQPSVELLDSAARRSTLVAAGGPGFNSNGGFEPGGKLPGSLSAETPGREDHRRKSNGAPPVRLGNAVRDVPPACGFKPCASQPRHRAILGAHRLPGPDRVLARFLAGGFPLTKEGCGFVAIAHCALVRAIGAEEHVVIVRGGAWQFVSLPALRPPVESQRPRPPRFPGLRR